MPDSFPAPLKKKIEDRLRYYEDLGIQLFYRDRVGTVETVVRLETEPEVAAPTIIEEIALPQTAAAAPPPLVPSAPSRAGAPVPPPPEMKKTASPFPTLQEELSAKAAAASSLFVANKDASLLAIRDDLGECTRCKLHKTRNKIVFGDGSDKARLVFVGEGPGADEDAQGLPFVGRAGKLLTQMIEAMGLQRKDVYICNVVKCRPPQNRAPEPDEVAQCSPFLLRQIDFIDPKVIVCLGATAAKTLLDTNRGISHFRGDWLEWRGRKLMATYHPAYLLRNPPAKSEVWKDLQKVMAELGLKMPQRSKPS
jgi:uracil-DNA glycosylase